MSRLNLISLLCCAVGWVFPALFITRTMKDVVYAVQRTCCDDTQIRKKDKRANVLPQLFMIMLYQSALMVATALHDQSSLIVMVIEGPSSSRRIPPQTHQDNCIGNHTWSRGTRRRFDMRKDDNALRKRFNRSCLIKKSLHNK